MTVRGLSAVTGWSELAAGVTVALLAGAIATVLVWRLAARLAGEKVADRAVMLFVFFPGSFALSMAYAEGFMVVGAAACLLALLNRRWVLAGVAGAFATASRPNAVAVVIACAAVAAVEIYRRREWKALLAPALASTGALAFFTFLWIRTGHALAWFQSEKDEWHDHLGYGQGVWKRVTGLFRHIPTSFHPGALNDLVAVAGVIVVIGSLVLLWRSRWPVAIRVYTAAALVIPALSVAVGPRPRMLFGAFPMAIAVADRSSRTVYRVAVIASAVILVAVTILITTSLSSTP
jgi:4-amino-4-deoxy-L-arabinose transferase-like glycosyltransferase